MQQQLDALFAERCESSKLMTGTTKILTETTRLDEPNDGVRRRRRRRSKSRKFVYFNCMEGASQPAFQLNIEDCHMLIDFFSSKSTTVIGSSEKPEAGYAKPAQEIWQVEAAPDNLAIVTRKRKGEEEESFFVSGKGKNKRKEGRRAPWPMVLMPPLKCP